MNETLDHLSKEGGATGGQRLAFAFDLDGTIYLGERLLPGAVELLAELTTRGWPYVFATNNSSATVAAYQRRLSGLGIDAERSQIVTSNDVAQDHLLGLEITRPYLVATPEVQAEYAVRGIVHERLEPDAVLLTYDTTIDYAKLRDAANWLRSGLPFLATNPDLVCPTPTGPVPDCGAFIALLASATGRAPLVLGKPHAAMAGTISRRLGHPAATAFVGDRLYTDVRMANEQGFTAVLTLTGEASAADLADSEFRPDMVVRDLWHLLAELDALASTVLAAQA